MRRFAVTMSVVLYFIAAALFFFFVFGNSVIGNLGVPYANLSTGLHVLVFDDEVVPFYAHSLVSLNPSIDVISYDDPLLNRTLSYVNAFGGIGEDFVLVSNVTYTLYVSEETLLYVP